MLGFSHIDVHSTQGAEHVYQLTGDFEFLLQLNVHEHFSFHFEICFDRAANALYLSPWNYNRYASCFKKWHSHLWAPEWGLGFCSVGGFSFVFGSFWDFDSEVMARSLVTTFASFQVSVSPLLCILLPNVLHCHTCYTDANRTFLCRSSTLTRKSSAVSPGPCTAFVSWWYNTVAPFSA